MGLRRQFAWMLAERFGYKAGSGEMAKTEISIIINQPITKVFAFVADCQNLPRWTSRAYDVTITSVISASVGMTFLGVGRFLGQRIESPQEVIEFELNKKYAIKSVSGPLTFVLHYAFESADSGTRIVFVGEVEPGRFFKAVQADLASAVKVLCETDLSRLKNLLEGQPIETG